MQRLSNRRELKGFRKALRNEGTPSERVLWRYLKAGQLEGRKFRRQHSIGPFILDFYCPSEKLCVELDGAVHNDPTASMNDQGRDAFLRANEIRVVRFDNKDLLHDIDGVLSMIRAAFRH
jgi:very-short-patch-repair endonuclease